MKIYIDADTRSIGIQRVVDNLDIYSPDDVTLTHYIADADLVVIHVTGRRDGVERKIKALNGKPYVVIQYVLKSSKNPDPHDWVDIWNNAVMVMSYYDLYDICFEHQIKPKFDFFHSPLGVDFGVFKDKNFQRRFVIGACSQSYLTESAKECYLASKAVNKNMFYLGDKLSLDNVLSKSSLSDSQVADYWSQCRFVSGLRRCEGFEFPIIEGAMCGARPIVFDRPEMRYWFNDLAIFIPEEPREKVVESLIKIFRNYGFNMGLVSREEKELIKKNFNWQVIISNFYERIKL